MKLRALHDKILCSEIEKGQQTLASGIILMDDDGKEDGIRPRWMQVYATGPDVSDDITVGQWILVEHGRWSHGHRMREGDNELTLWQAEEASVLLVADERPSVERSPTSAN